MIAIRISPVHVIPEYGDSEMNINNRKAGPY
jgi:hypothetical protein